MLTSPVGNRICAVLIDAPVDVCGCDVAANPSKPHPAGPGESPSKRVLTEHPSTRVARRTVDDMDNRAEVRDFLVSRRAKITPQQAGIPDIGRRRVPGLRRGEVATLAGVSIEYYSKLERGSLAGVSASVLDAIARALRLDDAE